MPYPRDEAMRFGNVKNFAKATVRCRAMLGPANGHLIPHTPYPLGWT